MNYHIDPDRNLTDPQGNSVGKVDYDNHVRDGWRDKGSIDPDDRYHDEYGRDQGWTTQTSGGGGDASTAATGALYFLVFALFVWIVKNPTARRVVITLGLIFALVMGILTLLMKFSEQANDRDIAEESAWVLAHPAEVLSFTRDGDGPCYGATCEVKTGNYTFYNHLQKMNLHLIGQTCGFTTFGEVLEPGQAITRVCEEISYGKSLPACFNVFAIQKSGFGGSEVDVFNGQPYCVH